MGIYFTGLLLGVSLLLAIGPQNTMLIKQGIKRDHLTLIIIICLVSDLALFTLGILGVGLISSTAPIVLSIMRWAGIAFLLWFAAMSVKDAINAKDNGLKVIEHTEVAANIGDDSEASSDGLGGTAVATTTRTQVKPKQISVEKHRSWIKPALMAMALTWFNPNAYLDAFVFIGGLGTQYGDPGKWIFMLGVFTASLIWFPLVGYGAAALSRPLSSPKVWKWINIGIAVILTSLALRLVFNV